MANFPTSLDTLTNPKATDYLNSPSHAGQHATANDILEALEAKVGITSSAVTTSHDYKLALITGTAKALPDSYLDTDGTLAANSDVKLSTQKAVKTYVDNNGGAVWKSVSDSWSYAGADAPTFTITVPSGAASIYGVGMRIKLTQTTVKYFIVTAVADTVLTVYGGTDYTLANAAISAISYSTHKAPLGFPLSPTKWTVETTLATEATQGSPTGGTWYNIGSLSLSIPIGAWDVFIKGTGSCFKSGGTTQLDFYATLSTGSSSESNANMTAGSEVASAASSVSFTTAPFFARDTYLLDAKTLVYLNCKTNVASMTTLYLNRGPYSKIVIRAICLYL